MFVAFLSAFLISVLGSLPIGVLNLTAVDIGVRKTWIDVLWFCLAAAIVEYIQGFIALQGSSLFASNPHLKFYIELGATPIFFILGIFYLYQHRNPSVARTEVVSDFSRGIILSIVNPMAIPFWVIWGAFATQKSWLDLHEIRMVVLFSLGIAMGSFLVLFLYGLAGKAIVGRLTVVRQRMNQILGWLLIGLGLLQVAFLIKTYANFQF